MPQVAVQIAGKTYRMACDEGQEAHLMELAKRLDSTIDTLRGSFGEIGDQRLTVMAGVMLADQLSEAQARVRVLEADLKSMRRGEQVAERNAETDTQVAAALDRTAGQIERLGDKLKTVPQS